jgi:tagaturonate epimerase
MYLFRLFLQKKMKIRTEKMENIYLQIYSLGMGDRLSHQADAQLKAIQVANQNKINITLVWNKSHCEH